MAHRVYYGPFYFRRESEPYMTLSVAGTGRDAGVSVAEVNLKFIWDMVSQTKVGQRGVGFILDGQGRVIAHPVISLVLRDADFSSLPQVEAARRGNTSTGIAQGAQAMSGKDINGHDVLVAYARVSPLGWFVFLEIPVEDADSLAR